MARVVMPQLGESVAEGTIGKWLKKQGDHVAKDEPLLEVITDKVNAEVPSPFSGVLSQILVAEGATVPHDAEIAVIDEGDGAATSTAEPSAKAASAVPSVSETVPLPEETAESGEGRPLVPVMEARTAQAAQPRDGDQPRGEVQPRGEELPRGEESAARMTPAVRMLLREHGLSAAQITGTGHGGRITREDVMHYVDRQGTGQNATQSGAATAGGQPARSTPVPLATAGAPASSQGAPAPTEPSPSPSPSPLPAEVSGPSSAGPSAALVPTRPPAVWEPGQDEVLIPHTQMRRGVAAQMTRAAAVPTAFSTFEADMSGVAKLRAAQGEAYKSREGIGLSYLPFVVKAVVEALHGNPDLNAHYTEDGLLRKRRINVGIAIAVENGLIVPVIHDADQLSINGIAHAISDLSARARVGRLRVDDLQGGTFTVDNTGWFGSLLTVPILNVPEVCILTTEAVRKIPVVRETPEGDVLAIRPMMNLVAGYDHRATDGAQVGRFVGDVICWLEAIGPEMPIY